jgi:hypothetical protein
VRLEGFEPPTRGLGKRLHRSYAVLVCQRIPLIYAVFDVLGTSVFLLSSAQFWSGCSTVAVHFALEAAFCELLLYRDLGSRASRGPCCRCFGVIRHQVSIGTQQGYDARQDRPREGGHDHPGTESVPLRNRPVGGKQRSTRSTVYRQCRNYSRPKRTGRYLASL